MSKLKINWKAGSSSMAVRALSFNDVQVASTNQNDAIAIAKAHGKSNFAPFQIKNQRALIGDTIAVTPKGTNIIQVLERRTKNGQYKPVKKSLVKFEATASAKDIKLTVKKRGFFFGLFFGRYNLKVKVS